VNTIKPFCGLGQSGSATVEAGVTLSLLLLFILGTVQFAQTLFAYNTMLLAIEETGRYAMLHNHRPLDVCTAQKQVPKCPLPSNTALANCAAAVAQQLFSLYQGSIIDVSVTEDRTTSPPRITICASYPVDPLASALFFYPPLSFARRVTVPLI
jgi:TadE-like protein